MSPWRPSAPPPAWHLYLPKLITILREGYGLADFRADVVSGLTVAIVALPLAMELGIASGTTPEKGLITAVVAGFLISALAAAACRLAGQPEPLTSSSSMSFRRTATKV